MGTHEVTVILTQEEWELIKFRRECVANQEACDHDFVFTQQLGYDRYYTCLKCDKEEVT
jgi:hypothetical protein